MESNGHSEDGDDHGGGGPGPHKNHYFVDGEKYEAVETALTGAQIKARIANFNPAYQLVLEGRANEADRVIADNETISITPPPPMLYTVPPANFG